MLTGIAATLALIVMGQTAARTAPAVEEAPPPTQIRLDFQNQTLAEIVEGINAQSPGSLAISTQRDRRLPGEIPLPATPRPRFSLHEPKPVTFWEAVERVERASGTLALAGNTGKGIHSMILFPASPGRGFIHHDGVLRIMVTGTYYLSAYQFAPHFFNQPGLPQPNRDGSSRQPVVYINLLITAEPRLKILGLPETVADEAVDDRGRGLLNVTPWRESRRKPHRGPKGFSNEDFAQVVIKGLDDPGKTIKRLRGKLSVELSDHDSGSPARIVEASFDFRDIPLP